MEFTDVSSIGISITLSNSSRIEIFIISNALNFLHESFNSNSTSAATGTMCQEYGSRRLEAIPDAMRREQVVRIIITYTFAAWADISSAQMERIRMWERRILISCLEMRSTIDDSEIYRRRLNRNIYNSV